MQCRRGPIASHAFVSLVSVKQMARRERSQKVHKKFPLRTIFGGRFKYVPFFAAELYLIDLAGSERLDESGAAGERRLEAINKNNSLTELGILLRELKLKTSFQTYRNTKLNFLLQRALRGNSKVVLFIHISPKEENKNESLRTLQFAHQLTVELPKTPRRNSQNVASLAVPGFNNSTGRLSPRFK